MKDIPESSWRNLDALRNAGGISVPFPLPNLGCRTPMVSTSTFLLVKAAEAHGFSPDGAKQMYEERQQPRSMPDKLVLTRFYSNSSKVLVQLITPDLPPPPPGLAPASTPSITASEPPPPPPPPSLSSTETPTSGGLPG